MSKSFDQSTALEAAQSHPHPMPPKSPPSTRWHLRLQAIIWRFLMSIGMFLHKLAPPRPRPHSFTRGIPTNVSPKSGSVVLYFYTPLDYRTQKARGKSQSKYPVVVNFHGGGFTLGTATDDARWAATVVEETGAVVVSVDYRLAPEYPFPTAVEDGVDAVLYLWKHAEELHLDSDRIAVSGFSCGGNLAFTVPMRLHEELHPSHNSPEKSKTTPDSPDDTDISRTETGASTVTTTPSPLKSGGACSSSRDISRSVEPVSDQSSKHASAPLKLAAIVSWYPSADYTLTREQRRATLQRKDMELSPAFTALFDAAYITPHDLPRANPYLSPGLAPEALLRDSLPQTIVVYTCEWDVLQVEGQKLQQRLRDMGKRVSHTMVERVPHAWDKSPNPFHETPGVREHYREACQVLKRAFQRGDENGGTKLTS